jgi:integrase
MDDIADGMEGEPVRIPKKHPEKALTAVKIRNAKAGTHADGNSLYLVVDESGSKRWMLRTVIQGRRRELGLGGLNTVSLAEAREEATKLHKIARAGGDPIAERRKAREIVPSFEAVAREVHKQHAETFRNPKHAAQWISTLQTYAFSLFGSASVDSIESRDVLAALTPIWNEKPETARRVKQRMRAVFDYAKAKGWRSQGNPVEGITKVLPRHSGSKDHFPALPYAQVPEFIVALREANVETAIKYALEFTILTAARTSEALLAKWNEIDAENKTWVVPAERMKMKREHRVPLSVRCLEILKAAKELPREGPFIFSGRSQGKSLSQMAMLMALRRMGRTDITVHGFRSSFRDWTEEKTNTQRSVVEAALAHRVESKVEAAYLRTDLFEKRRRLMELWGAFTTAKPSQKVVKIREA